MNDATKLDFSRQHLTRCFAARKRWNNSLLKSCEKDEEKAKAYFEHSLASVNADGCCSQYELCRSPQARGPAVQTASSPDSPVLIRMASSMFETKIFPSPIRPVWAARWIASTAFSILSSPSTISILTLGRKSPTYSAPR